MLLFRVFHIGFSVQPLKLNLLMASLAKLGE